MSKDLAVIAQLLMTRCDRNGNGLVDAAELGAMKKELRDMAKAPFYIFLDHKAIAAGADMHGMIVLDCKDPVHGARCAVNVLQLYALSSTTLTTTLLFQHQRHTRGSAEAQVH